MTGAFDQMDHLRRRMAHARDELGISEAIRARPVQAALARPPVSRSVRRCRWP
jgi:hypothetical protein